MRASGSVVGRSTTPVSRGERGYLNVACRPTTAPNGRVRARPEPSVISRPPFTKTDSARRREMALWCPDIAASLKDLDNLMHGDDSNRGATSSNENSGPRETSLLAQVLAPSASAPCFPASSATSASRATSSAYRSSSELLTAPRKIVGRPLERHHHDALFEMSTHGVATVQGAADGHSGSSPRLTTSMPRLTLVEHDESNRDRDHARALAVKTFNHRHLERSTGARGLLTAIDSPRNVDWTALGRGYDKAVIEVFRNRLWVEQKHDPFDNSGSPPAKPARRKHVRWRLPGSIWHPRKTHGNSHDYYETDESRKTIFDSDWEHARVSVAKCIEVVHRRESRAKQPSADKSSEQVHHPIEDVEATLWKHRRAIYSAFDYYATLLDGGKDFNGEQDIYNLTWVAYMEFTRDCAIVGPTSKIHFEHVDLIWVSVNAIPHDTGEKQRLPDRWNHPRTMCRHEFLEAIVRIAVELFMRHGTVTIVATAVERLCTQIEKKLPPEALQDSNAFRKAVCYNEPCDIALTRQKESLLAIYRIYAKANQNAGDVLADSKQMSIGEWMAFVEHVDLFENEQISHFGAKIIFQWSMIRACPGHTAKAERMMRHMSFVDFCEAIVRIACIVALPTDVELEAAGAFDAGEFLHALQDEQELAKFVSEHKVGWQSPPRQHVSRCVTHFMSLIIRTIKQDVHSKKLQAGIGAFSVVMVQPLTEDEVTTFVRRRKVGERKFHVQSKAGLADGIMASASIVRKRLLESLHKVEIFENLSQDQMLALCNAMTQAMFDEGMYVFDQGDDGQTFYVITEGEAEVLRTEPNCKKEKELAILGEGDFFGERALLRNQVRYAGVRASSKQLFTMFITRADFERAIGMRLEDVVSDQYKLEEAELLTRLETMPIFQRLMPHQLQLVADRCTDVRFKQGDDVVTQGEKGNAFYIITKGNAHVLRYPEGDFDAKPELLAELGPWDAFGERALMKHEARYATVRVMSRDLVVMSLASDVFSDALGLNRTRYKGRSFSEPAPNLPDPSGLRGFVRKTRLSVTVVGRYSITAPPPTDPTLEAS